MSDLSLKRTAVFTTILALTAASSTASNPSARYETRMAYNATTTHMILFGGATAVDKGTAKAYVLGDTWEWTGARWIQRFPNHGPPARSGHVMVYDPNRDQIVLFGGRDGKNDLSDTWLYKNSDWVQVSTPNSPPARILCGAAYDPVRDRMVLSGGTQTSTDGKTLTAVHDTWEFDGTTWKQIGGSGPNVGKPILAYDAAHNQILMLAQTDTLVPQMYTYDGAAGAWNQVSGTLPPCVNEGQMTYQTTTQTVIYSGGVCSNTTSAVDDTYEWDGSNWNKLEVTSATVRVFGGAFAFDEQRQSAVLFGGTPPLGNPVADTWIFGAKTWVPVIDPTLPGPRSLFVFTTDPVNNSIWMLGGIDERNTLDDFWQYQNGAWQSVTADNVPVSCATPNGAFDTDRQVLVVVCADSSTHEWDGTTWKAPTGLKTVPPARRFSSMVYDQNLKKIVLFGGFNDVNRYVDETWLWDGTQWERQKKNPAPARSLAAMWFDPTLKKTVLYGGIGRVTTNDRITRFSDMWTFDGNGWAELKPSGGTPGSRYGGQATVDPRSNHVLLFGGLRADTQPPVPPATISTDVQVYANDTWEWDGSIWKQLTTDGVPPARENGAIAFDPTRNELVLFGGYAGAFLSDMWTFNPNHWQVRIMDPMGGRRRVAR